MKNILFVLQTADPDSALDNLDAALTCAALGQQTSVLLLNHGADLLFSDKEGIIEKLGLLPLYGVDAIHLAAADYHRIMQPGTEPVINQTLLQPLSEQAVREMINQQDTVFRF